MISSTLFILFYFLCSFHICLKNTVSPLVSFVSVCPCFTRMLHQNNTQELRAQQPSPPPSQPKMGTFLEINSESLGPSPFLLSSSFSSLLFEHLQDLLKQTTFVTLTANQPRGPPLLPHTVAEVQGRNAEPLPSSLCSWLIPEQSWVVENLQKVAKWNQNMESRRR